MKIVKFVRLLLLLLILAFAILFTFSYLIPKLKSNFVYNYRVKSSSIHFKSGFYKIPRQSISILKIENNYIVCQTENYFINPGKETILRKLPIPFNNAHKTNDWILTTLENHQYMETPVLRKLKNRFNGDSLMIYMENFESQPELLVYKNYSDTTLILIKNCNFKRSDYCELGFVFVWPKSK